MGSLDPMVSAEHKARAFELLRAKGATQAVVEFNGGHDEGGAEAITLTVPVATGDPLEIGLEVWYCGGYQVIGAGEYKRVNEPENDDQELSELLQGPVDDMFGTWASVDSTHGFVTWLVDGEKVTMNYSQDEPREHEVEF